MAEGPGDAAPSSLRVTVTPATAALAGLTLLGVTAAWNVVVSARSVLATAVAAAVLAVFVSGPVSALERRVPRVLAIPMALLGVVILVGVTAYVVYDDVDAAFARLQREAPEAAAELEQSDRFGEIARDLRLEERVSDAVDRLRAGTQDRAEATAFRAVNYFVAVVLAIFLLVYGPRLVEGALGQIDDEQRRERLRSIASRAFHEGRAYLGLQLANAVIVALGAAAAFHAIGLPGSSALAVLMGLGSVIPDVGVFVGSVPALLLTAAAEPFSIFLVLCGGVIAVQAVDSWFAHRRLTRELDVGPAVTLLAVLIGFAVYGVGGALFGVALAVFASAVIDAVGEDRETAAPSAANGH